VFNVDTSYLSKGKKSIGEVLSILSESPKAAVPFMESLIKLNNERVVPND
jgi:hypothetical protein